MEFSDKDHEHVAGSVFSLYLKMTTFLPEEGEEIMYTSCSDIPYEIELSDTENFEVTERSSEFMLPIASQIELSQISHKYYILSANSNVLSNSSISFFLI